MKLDIQEKYYKVHIKKKEEWKTAFCYKINRTEEDHVTCQACWM